MPALITHRLFGEESAQRLSAGLLSIEDERTAFLIANQGPDPFFFRFRSLNAPACSALGHRMHASRMTRQFASMCEGVEHLNERDAGVGRAFVLGLLSHYVLDRTAHPFVYAQQWAIQSVDEDLKSAGSEVHAVIESDLDVLMLQIKRDGATVADYQPAGALATSDRVDRVAGALTSFMARRVYGIEIGASEYGGAVADMQLVYRLIEPAGAPASRVIGACEGLLRDYSLLGALAHRVTDVAPAGAGNLARTDWRDPFTDEVSRESFPEVFDRALDEYEAVAACLVRGEVDRAIGHVNYSGRVLDDSEEFEGEE